MIHETLGDVFPNEIKIAKQKLEAYKFIGPAGTFACSWIEPLIESAENAWAEQDTVQMIALYKKLEDIAW